MLKLNNGGLIMEIKDKLKELRKENKYTQKQIAELLNISATGYASWEQGLAEPNLTAIKKICKLYNITADELLDIQ